MGSCEIDKISISCFDDKRVVLNDGIHTLTYFHKDLKNHRWSQIKNVCANKFSIGRLIGVHVSSIVKWGYQDNFKPVYFFYEKISRAQKAPKRKTRDFYHLRSLRTQKVVALVVYCLLNFALLVNVCLWVFLCSGNLFVKK